MIIKFEDILPNPYKDLTRNPLREDTIERLRLSVRSTGFWSNVSVRKAAKEGKYELHAGHHRLDAAKLEGLTEADFRVQDIDDAGMVKVKHNEDSARRAFDSPTMIESVRAVVKLLAEGKIKPFEINEKTKKETIRYAPSFVAGRDDTEDRRMRYTAFSIAEFLDETENAGGGTRQANKAVRTALDALALIEQQELSEAALKDTPLDNPSGDTKQMGLIQKVRLKKAQIETRQDLTRAQQERAAVDAKRREAEAEDKARRNELLRKESEAQAEHNAKKLREVAEQRKQEEARAEERKVAFNTERAKLDVQLKEANERAKAALKHDKTLPVRHAVAACLFKLKTITSERFSFREELKTLAREKALTQAERENIRQGLLAVATWYEEASIAFRPVIAVDVLAEAKQREESKRKRAHNNE